MEGSYKDLWKALKLMAILVGVIVAFFLGVLVSKHIYGR